jgi:FkbM family methyltransferase
VLEQLHKFQEVYDLLDDDDSRRTLIWFIKFRIACFLLQSKEEAGVHFSPVISPAEWRDMSEKAKALPENILEENLDIDLIENFLLDGYNLPGICGVEPHDVVLDLGAFNGNSSIAFSRPAGPQGTIYAFEPNPVMQGILARNLAKMGCSMGCSNVEIIPRGAGDKPDVLKFTVKGAASRFDPDGEIDVPVGKVDDFVFERGLSKVDFIKLDVEGHELPALRGRHQLYVHSGRSWRSAFITFITMFMRSHFLSATCALGTNSIFVITRRTTASLSFSASLSTEWLVSK